MQTEGAVRMQIEGELKDTGIYTTELENKQVEPRNRGKKLSLVKPIGSAQAL